MIAHDAQPAPPQRPNTLVRSSVVDVVAVEERDEDVHVEERPAHSPFLLAELVDERVRHDAAAARERHEPVRAVLERSRPLADESRARELREHLAGAPPLAPRSLADGLQDIVVDVQGGAHRSDASASGRRRRRQTA